jgi:hypothetical protein
MGLNGCEKGDMMADSKDRPGRKRRSAPIDLAAGQHLPLYTPQGDVASAASEPRDEDVRDALGEEAVAATDEFFKQQPVLPTEPQVVEDSETPLSGTEEERGLSLQDATAGPSALQNYVRELQQEFEEQEEEGKV